MQQNKDYIWQSKALEVCKDRLENGVVDCVIVAGTGSGKTLYGTKAARYALATRKVERIIVVVPKVPIAHHWNRTMSFFQFRVLTIQENSKLSNGLPSDCEVYIITYAAMASMPDLHQKLSSEVKTMVIFDEIHHLADDPTSDWGKKAVQAFGGAAFRLALSGTPWRSRGDKIPFVRYKPDITKPGDLELSPDYIYSYGDSVSDRVCRRMCFKEYDGQITFTIDGRSETCSFADKLDPYRTSKRLLDACCPKNVAGSGENKLLDRMLTEAYAKLKQVRKTHPEAAMIIFCIDQNHAYEIEIAFKRCTGISALVVTSDDDAAHKKIDQFRESSDPCIIAVQMISEGVDIPRLRINVFCTNITEKLAFIQMMGRSVRNDHEHFGESYTFMFADSRLHEIANEIEEEIKVAIERKKKGTGGGSGPGLHSHFFEQADGQQVSNILSGEEYSPDDIEAAESLRHVHIELAAFGLEKLAQFTKEARGFKAARSFGNTTPSYEQSHHSLRTKLNRAAKRFAYATNQEFSHVNSAITQSMNASDRDSASLEQLKKGIEFIKVEYARNNVHWPYG